MDPKSAPFRARLRYAFDNTIARGSSGLIGWLAVVTAVMVIVAGLILQVHSVFTPHGERGLGFVEGTWRSLLRTLDPGTMGGDAGWGYRLVSLAVTLGGLFIVATLIGLITSAIDQRLEELRKGRSHVLESGHSLILGWSEKVHSVISELVIANDNQKDACIVVMSSRDKVAMEDEIRDRTRGKTGPTRIVCRTGDPTDPDDLELVNPHGARSVIVLAPSGDESPDAQVVKTVLGLMSFDRTLDNMGVVAELTDSANARTLEQATGDQVRTVVSTDLIARITAQVCRQAGMSLVYQELLDFDGDEVYFTAEPRLIGATYGQALTSYETSALIGVRSADGSVILNPPMSRVFAQGDQVIAISEDDDTVTMSALDGWAGTTIEAAGDSPAPRVTAERTLVLGWNLLGPKVVRELDKYVPEGSIIDVLLDPTLADATGHTELAPLLRNVKLNMHGVETSDPDRIADALNNHRYDQLILLSYRDSLNNSEADARTLLTLLQIRRTLDQPDHPNSRMSIVTELLDVRAVRLAQIANPDDFVVSERLTSLLLAQLSENGELREVFEELMNATGCELNLRPASRYGTPGSNVTFGDLVAAAREHSETAIGIRSQHLDPDDGLGGGVLVNPPKSRVIALHDDDQVIVLGE